MATAIFISVNGYSLPPDIGHNSPAVEAVQNYSVLVVDDDPSIRKMVIAALKRDAVPYTFAEAGNGRDALDAMRDQIPDVVVLDLMMPLVSGWDVLRERAGDDDLRKIPVIVVSANRDPELATAVQSGICAFLPKPFDIGALRALVRSCVSPIVAPVAEHPGQQSLPC
ncbi:MAG: two-component system response regulator [Thermoanaerobaculia bacterium]